MMQNVNLEEKVINLSKEKWHWMSERDVDALDVLFHEKAAFVQMGGSWGKGQELDIIQLYRVAAGNIRHPGRKVCLQLVAPSASAGIPQCDGGHISAWIL